MDCIELRKPRPTFRKIKTEYFGSAIKRLLGQITEIEEQEAKDE